MLLGLATALLAPNFAHGQNLRPHDETAFLEKLAPGSPSVTTKANPQSVVSRSGMKLALNFTEAIRDTEGFSRRLEDDANLKKWCEDACKERE